ncbi:MAG: hypothetical protein WCO96_02430 [Actinomycetes bacterium]
MRKIAAAIAASALIAVPAAAQAATPASPIGNVAPATTLPTFSGNAWTKKPITATKPPQNPYMAANGNSNLHNDAWMTDTYWRSGPLGKNLKQTTNSFGLTLPGLCASLTFDTAGRLLTICPNLSGPKMRLLDPVTLDLIAEQQLPSKSCPDQVTNPFCVSGNIFQDFSGGGYFYLDNQNRFVVGANDRTIRIYSVNAQSNGFNLDASYDLSSVLSEHERFSSALPDWQGRIWFVTRPGKVGYIVPGTGQIRSVNLGEPIQNSFTVAQDAVYVPTDSALYKFDSSGDAVRRLWRTVYPNTGVKKPGQAAAGTGTTPTILPGNLVAITDNADPMGIVVYKGSTGAKTCRVPVFNRGASATENSLIGFGTSTKSSLIVENNFGYDQPASVMSGETSRPGFTRVDVSNSGRTCKTKWKNTTDVAPSVVAKVSVSNGLLYTYTKPKTTNGSDAWFWTAIDVATGKRVWSRLAGTGLSNFNNNYAAIHIGPDGALYIGLLGGVARLSDGS